MYSLYKRGRIEVNGRDGINSELNRSIWKTDIVYREYLMQILMKCKDAKIQYLVNNLSDLRKLLKVPTNVLNQYLENCFNTNMYTEQIQNVKLYSKGKIKKNREAIVVGSNVSGTSEKTLDELYKNSTHYHWYNKIYYMF